MGIALQVCKKWNQILSENDKIWENHFQNRWKKISHPTKIVHFEESSKKSSWKKLYQIQHAKDAKLAKGAHADLDKAGDAVEFLFDKIMGKNKEKIPKLKAGAEIYYGPIDVYSASSAKKIWENIKDLTLEQLLELWTPEEKNFPDVLGGMLCTKERMKEDKEYLSWHIVGYKVFIENVVRRGHGFVQYYS